MRSHARLSTDEAERYGAQLARLALPVGPCQVLAESDGLTLTVEAADMAGLVRLEDVVSEQLRGLSASRPVERLAWTRAWEAGRIDPPALRINRLRG